jgi:hypothetical protein
MARPVNEKAVCKKRLKSLIKKLMCFYKKEEFYGHLKLSYSGKKLKLKVKNMMPVVRATIDAVKTELFDHIQPTDELDLNSEAAEFYSLFSHESELSEFDWLHLFSLLPELSHINDYHKEIYGLRVPDSKELVYALMFYEAFKVENMIASGDFSIADTRLDELSTWVDIEYSFVKQFIHTDIPDLKAEMQIKKASISKSRRANALKRKCILDSYSIEAITPLFKIYHLILSKIQSQSSVSICMLYADNRYSPKLPEQLSTLISRLNKSLDVFNKLFPDDIDTSHYRLIFNAIAAGKYDSKLLLSTAK